MPGNRIWAFWKTICHGRHIFLLPANETDECKTFFDWSVTLSLNKPIKRLVLFVESLHIAHDVELAINKYGGIVVPVYAKFLERIFPSRTSGEHTQIVFLSFNTAQIFIQMLKATSKHKLDTFICHGLDVL